MTQQRDRALVVTALASLFFLLVALFVWAGQDLTDGYRCSNGWVDPRNHVRLDGQPWHEYCLLDVRAPMHLAVPIPSENDAIRISAIFIFLSSVPPWLMLFAPRRKRGEGEVSGGGDVEAGE